MVLSMKVAIVGGGYGGLTAALAFSKAGVSNQIFECQNDLGGLAGSFYFEENEIEKFYHHWFTSDQAILNLVKEFGLEDKLHYLNSGNRIILSNRFYDLSKPISLLKFRAISMPLRIRLGLGVLFARTKLANRFSKKMTAISWSKIIFGHKITNTLWRPLLIRKFGDYHLEIAAEWLQNKLKLRGSTRKKGGEEVLVYLDGGFGALQKRIVEKIRILHTTIFTDKRVEEIERDKQGHYHLVTNSGESFGPFNGVLLTISAPEALKILQKIHAPDWKLKATGIRYCANRCLIIKTQGKILNSYWHTVVDQEFPFIAMIDHSNFDPRFSNMDFSLIYLSKYMPNTDEDFWISDDELLAKWGKILEKIVPRFDIKKVEHHQSWKADFAQPIPTRELSENHAKIGRIAENLYFSSMCNIFPQDRGTNFAVANAQKIALHMIDNLIRQQKI